MRRAAPPALLALVAARKDGGGDDIAVEVTRFMAALGGRIKDLSLDESDPNAPRVGVGAGRVMEGQTLLCDLTDARLSPAEVAPGAAALVNAWGELTFSKEELVAQHALTTVPGGP